MSHTEAQSTSRSAHWQRRDVAWLRQLAITKNNESAWLTSLSENEHQIMVAALSDQQKWVEFIEGKSEPKLSSGLSPSCQDRNDNDYDDEVDWITSVFHTRYMLFEQAFPDLFDDQNSNENLNPDLDNQKENSTETNLSTKNRAIDEENYDDESDDGKEISKKNLISNSIDQNPVATKMHDSASRENSNWAMPFDSMFFTLEYDKTTLLLQEKLDASDRQVNAESLSSGAPASVNFGAAQLSLQHLLAVIDNKRDMLTMSDQDLKNLFAEVRKNRSKWASEDKIGQEELYESCEKVVMDLRGYTEHSTPFLNKVRKQDAPDYYNIISNPMDLGTVLKKLKAFQYKNKTEFVGDLMLIWDNCLKYNANPQHFMRKHATAMRKKTLSLVELIPDIQVRTRAEVEGEEEYGIEDLNGDADADSEDDMQQKSSRKTQGLSSKRLNKLDTPAPSENHDNFNETRSEVASQVKEDSVAPVSIAGPKRALVPAGTPGTRMDTPVDSQDISRVERSNEEEEEQQDGDIVFKAWRSQSKKARARYSADRHKLLQQNRLLEEHAALIRQQVDMQRFQESEAEGSGVSSLKPKGQDGDTCFPPNQDPRSGELLYLPLYETRSGVSDLYSNTEFQNIMAPEDWLTFDDERFRPPKGLYDKMKLNAEQLYKIRKICSKVTTIKQIQMNAPPTLSSGIGDIDYTFSEPLGTNSTNESKLSMNPTVANIALTRVSSQILYHTGFEEVQPTVVEMFTDSMRSYMQNIATTLSLYSNALEGKRAKFTPEEIILHSLFENGIEDLASLESYIRDSIERYGIKLNDMHRKMRKHLADLLVSFFYFYFYFFGLINLNIY